MATALDVLGVLWRSYAAWVLLSNLVSLLVVGKLLHDHRQSGVKNTGSYLTHIVIANLAFADFGMGLIVTTTFSYANGDFHTLGGTACSIYGAFLVFILSQSIFMVLLLGYLRYRFLVHRPMSMKSIHRLIAGAYTFSVGYATAQFVLTGSKPVPSGFFCWPVHGRDNWMTILYTVNDILFCLVPAFGLLILYWRGYTNIKSDEASVGERQYSPKVARVGFAVVFVFFVTIFPYAAVFVYLLVVGPGRPLSPVVDAAFGCLVIINFGLNPIIYFFFQHEMSNVVRSYVPCLDLLTSSLVSKSSRNRTMSSSRTRSNQRAQPRPSGTHSHLFRDLDVSVGTSMSPRVCSLDSCQPDFGLESVTLDSKRSGAATPRGVVGLQRPVSSVGMTSLQTRASIYPLGHTRIVSLFATSICPCAPPCFPECLVSTRGNPTLA